MEMRIMDPEYGDKNVQVNKSDKDDIKKAKTIFNEKKKKGWLIFGYKPGEKIATLMRKFSTDFSRIVMTPPPTSG